MKIIDELVCLFGLVREVGPSTQIPILDRDEIDVSETPEAVAALIDEIRSSAARQWEVLSYDYIMGLIDNLPDVSEGDGRGDAALLVAAMAAVDDLIREKPHISPAWFNERLAGQDKRNCDECNSFYPLFGVTTP